MSCDLYDELTLRILRRKRVDLVYRSSSGEIMETATVLKDVFTRGDEEFVRLADDRLIRLDHLVRVDTVTTEGGC